MLTIKKEVCGLSTSDFWSGGKNNFETIQEMGKEEELFNLVCEVFYEGVGRTQLNDFVWFEFEFICENLGIEIE